MKIVIAGAGEVGTHLARKLTAEEGQEITLMDPSRETVEKVRKRLETFTLIGNPTHLHCLRTAQVHNADLFISVMPEESQNLMACMMASELGARSTIARINNHIYLQEEYRKIFEDFGVNRLIYPEELAAKEISDSFKYPWARVYIELLNGAFVLVGVKVRTGSLLVGRPLSHFKEMGEKKVHVVAIKRDQHSFIPRGNMQIEHGDVVYFIALRRDVEYVRQIANKEKQRVTDVILMGASRIALRTIEKTPSNIHFKIVEKNPERIKVIEEFLPTNARLYEGDGRDSSVLNELGVNHGSIFVALTENSETNILACLAAKRLGVIKTIAKEENIDYIPLAEKLDIGTIINKKLIAASYIYKELLGADTKNVKSLTFGHADVAELQARTDSAITKKAVKDLDLPEGITLGGLIRNGVPQMIDGDTHIMPYDYVIVFCSDISMKVLAKLFSTH